MTVIEHVFDVLASDASRYYGCRTRPGRHTMSTIDDDSTDQPIPTEEIFLELEELQEAAKDLDDDTPSPATSEDDLSGIKARIARLRAMLSDRGAPIDE